jgi:hypothetical protein
MESADSTSLTSHGRNRPNRPPLGGIRDGSSLTALQLFGLRSVSWVRLRPASLASFGVVGLPFRCRQLKKLACVRLAGLN